MLERECDLIHNRGFSTAGDMPSSSLSRRAARSCPKSAAMCSAKVSGEHGHLTV